MYVCIHMHATYNTTTRRQQGQYIALLSSHALSSQKPAIRDDITFFFFLLKSNCVIWITLQSSNLSYCSTKIEEENNDNSFSYWSVLKKCIWSEKRSKFEQVGHLITMQPRWNANLITSTSWGTSQAEQLCFNLYLFPTISNFTAEAVSFTEWSTTISRNLGLYGLNDLHGECFDDTNVGVVRWRGGRESSATEPQSLPRQKRGLLRKNTRNIEAAAQEDGRGGTNTTSWLARESGDVLCVERL